MRAPLRPFLIYAAGLAALVAASFLAAMDVLALQGELLRDLRRAWWMSSLVSYVAPCVAGVAVAGSLVRLLSRSDQFVATVRAHFARTAVWYIAAFWLASVFRANRIHNDLMMWRDAVLWSLVAILAALLTDAVVSVHRSLSSLRRPNEVLKPTAAPSTLVE